MPFRIALSGLDAASTDLRVTGHNIANADTNGFKNSRTEFADIYANSLQDVSTSTSGQGVKVARVAQQFGQGNMEFTSNNLDIAVNGEGFFVMRDDSNNESYTRAGAFSVDRDGLVVDHMNRKLQAFQPLDNSGDRFNTGATGPVVLPTVSGAPAETDRVTAGLNLSSSEMTPKLAWPAGPVDTTDPAYDATQDPNLETNITDEMFNHTTSVTLYDSLGTARTANLYYVNSGTPGVWHAYTYIDQTLASVNPATSQHHATLNFDTVGNLITNSGSVDPQGRLSLAAWEDDAIPGAGDGVLSNGGNSMEIQFDYLNTTQFGNDFSVNNMTQDGYASGRISGVDIDSTGVVFARFTNGQSTTLGQLALAKFNSIQNLRQNGNTSWAETYTSGEAQLGAAGTSSFGLTQSGALENSNVDLASELVGLITAQRNFQANAQVITTADSVTQTIINIR
ncbi:MAG: flagellar hook protein FlgE [Gammaproteobacteria bacterium]|nr:flagellar hook protein FlgE [Gammaproteobacteria bacterium]